MSHVVHWESLGCLCTNKWKTVLKVAGRGGGTRRGGRVLYRVKHSCCSVDCLGEFFVNMLKMGDRSAEIDPSSNISDGESDTTGRYFNFRLHAPSWPSICTNTAAFIHAIHVAPGSWRTRLAMTFITKRIHSVPPWITHPTIESFLLSREQFMRRVYADRAQGPRLNFPFSFRKLAEDRN